MNVANVSQGNAAGLPDGLRAAQAAVHLPEVQEILRRLADFKLGIFMPHMHDEQTGGFRPLPDNVMLVESGLEVSFQTGEAIAKQGDRFLPVGWVWRAGVPATVTACEMVSEDSPGKTGRYTKHKM